MRHPNIGWCIAESSVRCVAFFFKSLARCTREVNLLDTLKAPNSSKIDFFFLSKKGLIN